MARRTGMTVEVFSIGFGKPIKKWQWKGVQWQICYLIFGGYVRIAGMEKKGVLEPHQIPDGFYGKKPWARIKVALMGPLANIAFAFLAFSAIWLMGGRDRPFQEFTHIIGWVDPQSVFYEAGIRPGDTITSYNGKPYDGYEDLIVSTISQGSKIEIEGYRLDSSTGQKTPFHTNLKLDAKSSEEVLPTLLTMRMAAYLLYDTKPCTTASIPICSSGIQSGDRLFAIDGEVIFSLNHLQQLVNEPKAFVTIERNGQSLQKKVSRIKIADLALSEEQKSELDDWKHESGLKGKVSQLFFIPYFITNDAIIESPLKNGFSELEKGDKVVAVDGFPVASSRELLKQIQSRHLQIVVQRGEKTSPMPWQASDAEFEKEMISSHFQKVIASIGTNRPIQRSGEFNLLTPVQPVPILQTPQSKEVKESWEKREKEILQIKDPLLQAEELKQLRAEQNRLILGVDLHYLKDRSVIYNPAPWSLCYDGLLQTWATIRGLVMGNIHPKQLASPIAIVGVMQYGWNQGVKEALYWLAFISLNLGIFNLLPIPVLDGGHIGFSLWQAVTRRPVSSKVMERITIPFIILLVGFMLYLTFNDVAKLIRHFFM